MNAVLFVEAIHTAYRLGWALIVWIVLTAAAVTLGLYAIAVTVWWAGRGLWKTARRASGGPSWRRGRLRARIHARQCARASRTRTADHDYEEAA